MDKQLSIIIPSFKDLRIIRAIRSVRSFDTAGVVALIIVDGNSGRDFCELVSGELYESDTLVSEPDQGIFDALNKGLELVETEFVGWLGSDDLFSGNVTSREIIEKLREADLFVGDLEIFDHEKVLRRTYSFFSWWPRATCWGLHNPHYATFGRSEILKKYRFDINQKAADIGYFINIFSGSPKIVTSNSVVTYQAAGGFSNSDFWSVIKINYSAASFYRWRWPLAIVLKTGVKVMSMLLCRLRRRELPESLKSKVD